MLSPALVTFHIGEFDIRTEGFMRVSVVHDSASASIPLVSRVTARGWNKGRGRVNGRIDTSGTASCSGPRWSGELKPQPPNRRYPLAKNEGVSRKRALCDQCTART